MQLRVLDLEKHAGEWQSRLADLPQDVQDVYFSAGYQQIWQRNGDGAARGAVFESAAGAVLYPFLARDLSPVLGAAWSGYHDIASAYGYGGPLVHLSPARDEDDNGQIDPRGQAGDRWDEDARDTAGRDERSRLLAEFRTCFADWCAGQRVVTEFVRFHPLLATERGLERRPAVSGDDTTDDVDGAAAGDADVGRAPRIEVVPANVTVWCRLSTPEMHRATLTSSTRRNLRKAERAGLTCAVEHGDAAWSAFVDLYTQTMRRRQASRYYLFSRRYFDDCRELLGDAATLLCVRRRDTAASAPETGGDMGGGAEATQIVAAALFLRSPRCIHYHLGGSAAGSLAERPNNLLFVTAMDWGASLGATALHLGGGFRDGGDDELLRFKAGFSPLRARLHLGRCVHDHRAYERAVTAWQQRGGGDPGGFFPAYRAPIP